MLKNYITSNNLNSILNNYFKDITTDHYKIWNLIKPIFGTEKRTQLYGPRRWRVLAPCWLNCSGGPTLSPPNESQWHIWVNDRPIFTSDAHSQLNYADQSWYGPGNSLIPLAINDIISSDFPDTADEKQGGSCFGIYPCGMTKVNQYTTPGNNGMVIEI